MHVISNTHKLNGSSSYEKFRIYWLVNISEDRHSTLQILSFKVVTKVNPRLPSRWFAQRRTVWTDSQCPCKTWTWTQSWNTKQQISMNVVKIIMYEIMFHRIRIMVPTVAPTWGRLCRHCYTNVKLRRNFFMAFYSILSMVTVERFQCQLSHMTLNTAYCTSGTHGYIWPWTLHIVPVVRTATYDLEHYIDSFTSKSQNFVSLSVQKKHNTDWKTFLFLCVWKLTKCFFNPNLRGRTISSMFTKPTINQ